MADAKHKPPRSLITEQRDLDFEEWSIAHRGQALGPIGDNSAQPRPQPAGQDHDGTFRERSLPAHIASRARVASSWTCVRTAMDDLRSRFIDTKIDALKVGQPQLDGRSPFGRNEEQQETSAAGPQQLASERTGFQARPVHVVDHVVRDRLIESVV